MISRAFFCNICQSKLVFSHSTARIVSLRYSRNQSENVLKRTWTWSLPSFSLLVKVRSFESNAHSFFYGTLANFAEAKCLVFFSVGVIRGAASVSKHDARCSEASCTLAALCDNDHREDRLFSFSLTMQSISIM